MWCLSVSSSFLWRFSVQTDSLFSQIETLQQEEPRPFEETQPLHDTDTASAHIVSQISSWPFAYTDCRAIWTCIIYLQRAYSWCFTSLPFNLNFWSERSFRSSEASLRLASFVKVYFLFKEFIFYSKNNLTVVLSVSTDERISCSDQSNFIHFYRHLWLYIYFYCILYCIFNQKH